MWNSQLEKPSKGQVAAGKAAPPVRRCCGPRKHLTSREALCRHLTACKASVTLSVQTGEKWDASCEVTQGGYCPCVGKNSRVPSSQAYALATRPYLSPRNLANSWLLMVFLYNKHTHTHTHTQTHVRVCTQVSHLAARSHPIQDSSGFIGSYWISLKRGAGNKGCPRPAEWPHPPPHEQRAEATVQEACIDPLCSLNQPWDSQCLLRSSLFSPLQRSLSPKTTPNQITVKVKKRNRKKGHINLSGISSSLSQLWVHWFGTF